MITQLLLLQDSLDDYLDIFLTTNNPLFVALVVFLITLILVYVSYKHIYNPLLRKHKKEQEQYEINTAKLLAQFSELDPNPIVRINEKGTIVGLNKSAKDIFSFRINESNINSILNIDFDIKEAIQSDKQFVIPKQVGNKFYDINFHGVSFLEMAQLYFWDVTLKKEYDEQMKIYQKLLINTSTILQRTQEDERNRISQTLHDEVGQNLLLIKMNLNNYRKLIPLGLDESEYKRTMQILESIITRIREVAHNLKPVNLDDLGLITTIKSMCRNISKETGLHYNLNLPGKTNELPKELEISVYRILLESLNNIMRYSKATEFRVSLSINEEQVTFSVTDNGIGFKPKKLLNDKYISDGIGIMNMQENAERLKGSFYIDSAINKGTTITAKFPLNNKKYTKHEYKSISR